MKIFSRTFLCLLIGMSSLATDVKGQSEKQEKCLWRELAIPDFSYAGYACGESEPPLVEHKMFNVLDYGAVPNDHLSDRTAVEKAIRDAELNGSGIIYFPKGRYHLHKSGEPCTPIIIRGSNIIIRGEGAQPGGSELYMEGPNEPLHPDEKWTSPFLIAFDGRQSAPTLTKVKAGAEKGVFEIKVDNPDELKAGTWVTLRLLDNDSLCISQELFPYKVESDWKSFFLNGVHVNEHHQIKSVEGDVITFNEPVLHQVDSRFNWTLVAYPCIKEVGVEDIAFVGNWNDKFVHHRSWMDDGGFKTLIFYNTANSWIRRCRFTSVIEAAVVSNSANVSVYDCVINGNQGHSAIRSEGSSRTFIGAVLDEPSQWHSTGISKTAIGSVLWRNKTKSGSCFESHASQPRATLFDACEGGFMRGRAGGAIMNNPNHLDDLIFWNYNCLNKKGLSDFDFWADDTPYWRFLPPVFVGFHGTNIDFIQSQVKHDFSHGEPWHEESLYEVQLAARLGELPQWVIDLREKVNSSDYSALPYQPRVYKCGTNDQLYAVTEKLLPGDTILLTEGFYTNLNLHISASGAFSAPITICPEPGKEVIISGESSIQLLGDHIIIRDIDFVKTNHKEAALDIQGSQILVSGCHFYKPETGSGLKIGSGSKQCRYTILKNNSFIQGKSEASLVEIDHSTDHTLENNFFKGEMNKQIPVLTVLSDSNFITRNLIQGGTVRIQGNNLLLYDNTFKDIPQQIDLNTCENLLLINNFFVSEQANASFSGLSLSTGKNQTIACNYFNLTNEKAGPDTQAVWHIYNEKSNKGGSLDLLKNIIINAPSSLISVSGSASLKNKKSVRLQHNVFVNDRVNKYPVFSSASYSYIFNSLSNEICGYQYKGRSEFIQSEIYLRYDDSKVYTENHNQRISNYQVNSVAPCTLNLSDIVNKGFKGIPLGLEDAGCRRSLNK